MTIMRTPKKSTKVSKIGKLQLAIFTALLIGGILGYEASLYLQEAHTVSSSADTAIQVRFSPGGHCTQLVEQVIAKAQKSILVQAYSFTALPIAKALVAAHQRGVEIKLLVDRSQLKSKYAQVRYVMMHGIAVAVDKVPGIAHNKVMILDDGHVLTGSFNWTDAAEYRNAENLLLISDRNINKIYQDYWKQRASKAKVIQLTDL